MSIDRDRAQARYETELRQLADRLGTTPTAKRATADAKPKRTTSKLASYGRRGGQTERFRAVCLTPDEARRLGIALVCAADRAEETTA